MGIVPHRPARLPSFRPLDKVTPTDGLAQCDTTALPRVAPALRRAGGRARCRGHPIVMEFFSYLLSFVLDKSLADTLAPQVVEVVVALIYANAFIGFMLVSAIFSVWL